MENSQFNWEVQPHSILINGNADHSSLSNSSSETVNLNENAERENPADSEQVNYETPVSDAWIIF